MKFNLIASIEIAFCQKIDSITKSLIICYIIQINIYIRPFTVNIQPHESGKANSDCLFRMNELMKQFFKEESPIDLQYLAVDGDYGYNSEFEIQFDIILNHLNTYGIEGLGEIIQKLKNDQAEKKKCLILTDMIHFLKNRRTDIIIKDLTINGNPVPVEFLEEILYKSASIIDKSSLSKIQDQFPIEIFNFTVFSHVLNCRHDDLAFWMLPLVCWNECCNNRKIGKKTRLFLLECSIFALKKFYEIQCKLNKKMELMPRVAIKRALSTIAILWKEFKESKGIFNFAQFGTMLQEHYHGLIRGMAHGVDTLTNTINCISKSYKIQNIQNKFKINFMKKTRYSVGGIHFDNESNDYFDFDFDYKPEEIVNQLYNLSSYTKNSDDNNLFIVELISFADAIGQFSLRIPCSNKHFHYGRRIISREITNSQEIKAEKNEMNNSSENHEIKLNTKSDREFQNDLEKIDQLLNEEEESEEDVNSEEESEEDINP